MDRFWTAAQALFHPTRLGLVEPPNKVEKEEWVFVYGGSSECSVIHFVHLVGRVLDVRLCRHVRYPTRTRSWLQGGHNCLPKEPRTL